MMEIISPQNVERALQMNSARGDRLNGLFMSIAMCDHDAMRKMIHNNYQITDELLKIFYQYYEDHNKKNMLEKINELSEENTHCLFYVGALPNPDYDYNQPEKHDYDIMAEIAQKSVNGEKLDYFYEKQAKEYLNAYYKYFEINQETQTYIFHSDKCTPQNKYGNTEILRDCDFHSTKESKWADLDAYDEKHSIYVEDELGWHFSKSFENVSVAEALKETITHLSYHHYHQPETQDKELDLLLRKVYFDKELHEPTYFQALKRLNQSLVDAYTLRTKPLDYGYINAIIMLEDKAKPVFDKMDYRRQFGFYRSDMGQELLKYTYLTAFTKNDFNEGEVEQFLGQVKKADMWQTAQNIITHKIVKNITKINPLTQRWLDLNLILPKPKERMYRDYYEDDVKRGQYLNLYFSKEQCKR